MEKHTINPKANNKSANPFTKHNIKQVNINKLTPHRPRPKKQLNPIIAKTVNKKPPITSILPVG